MLSAEPKQLKKPSPIINHWHKLSGSSMAILPKNEIPTSPQDYHQVKLATYRLKMFQESNSYCFAVIKALFTLRGTKASISTRSCTMPFSRTRVAPVAYWQPSRLFS